MLQKNQVLPYVAEIENNLFGGIITLKYKNTIYAWIGSAEHNKVKFSITDIVLWKIIKDSIKLELKKFDLVGANNYRIATYKSWFNPRLVEYYEIKKSTKIMNSFVKMIKRMQEK